MWVRIVMRAVVAKGRGDRLHLATTKRAEIKRKWRRREKEKVYRERRRRRRRRRGGGEEGRECLASNQLQFSMLPERVDWPSARSGQSNRWPSSSGKMLLSLRLALIVALSLQILTAESSNSIRALRTNNNVNLTPENRLASNRNEPEDEDVVIGSGARRAQLTGEQQLSSPPLNKVQPAKQTKHLFANQKLSLAANLKERQQQRTGKWSLKVCQWKKWSMQIVLDNEH